MNNYTENINLEHIKQQIRCLTNQQGQTTDVLIPLETWERIIQLLKKS